ncbi:hypothetical protein SAMN05660909_05684 [Chitinophaga terrae (ex Kim and Jung 2007)]|uniref:Uncharacterized protein n=1 Tax=Chitinophaga terrae (ex Kim and Jung 2007) TaxID=408074 RepID=A0A1H4GSU0_9BACT|nr:hypothetical protein [Chitinophaga terrae (ex Kim and Jung 2007)]GEP93729.1 hypothetical protein CTE07_53740 [Chitinophaga terrae (ex Kim and Jung 2007)]SEB12604.1 hypothetical protein SAMN05660909_05684 [Chitinophaga terrae (ex Kim and Jung 2007)]
MIDQVNFIAFIDSLFKTKCIQKQEFDSGYLMLDIFVNEKDMLVIQVEDVRIGISLIKDYLNYIDLSTISDCYFYSNDEAEKYLLGIKF